MIRIFIFTALCSVVILSCSNDSERFLIQYVGDDTIADKTNIIYNGIIVGKVISTNPPFSILQFEKKINLTKQDTLIYKHNLLGSAYIDVLKSNNTSEIQSFYTTKDTIKIHYYESIYNIDSNKKTKIINKLKNTFNSLDSILQEKNNE